jgi:phosphate transport system substrate-binding protein
MSAIIRFVSLVAAAGLIGANSFGADQPLTVGYGASIAAYCKKATEEFKQGASTKIEVLSPEGMASDSILKAVDGGMAKLGISGNSWENMMALIKDKKLDIKNLANIKPRVLGNDRVIFMTYPGGPTELNKEQLKSVLTGKVTNWKAVGGEDVPVHIILPNNTPSTQKTISQAIMDGEDFFRKGVKSATGDEELLKMVATTKGAISFGSPLTNFSTVNRPKHPDIIKPVTAITVGTPTPEAEKFMKLVEKALNP